MFDDVYQWVRVTVWDPQLNWLIFSQSGQGDHASELAQSAVYCDTCSLTAIHQEAELDIHISLLEYVGGFARLKKIEKEILNLMKASKNWWFYGWSWS